MNWLAFKVRCADRIEDALRLLRPGRQLILGDRSPRAPGAPPPRLFHFYVECFAVYFLLAGRSWLALPCKPNAQPKALNLGGESGVMTPAIVVEKISFDAVAWPAARLSIQRFAD